ncbi:hypothetical protein WICMUC_005393 [Wickerhamomyces mucosus]|uniref:Nucleoporin Nup54 alpha-helical domain-containing protein n=1 Tax=Wickerhamomyces mucosus TaxID=1378264 RepID=A0A9P8P8G5_9ASCO|nr:hypothetical protein WICMUC_005393 [Wickerhamomyces mucosus]
MFGSTSSSKEGFSFGAKPAATSTNSGGFGFGNNSNTQGTTPSTGIFGTNQASNTTNTGSAFGANSQAQTGGLFGSNNTNNSSTAGNTSTGGLFGSNTSTTGASSTGGLFGNKPTSTIPSSTNGLFGSSSISNASNSTSTGGLFGSNQPSTNTASGGLFGSNSSNTSTTTAPAIGGLFNNNNQQQQQTSQLQQQANNISNTSSQPSFAWSQQNAQIQGQQPQQQQPLSLLLNTNDSRNSTYNNNYSISIQEQLLKVKNSWDPNAQQNLLKTFFYNTVPENQSALYTKPANENEEWDKAYEKRPTTSSIPVRAVGFEDLQKRSQTQINHVAQARVILQQISEKYKILSDKHELDTQSRITSAKAKNTRISRRILKLVSTLAVLKSKGYQLSPSEEKLLQVFQELLEKSQDPSGLGKSNELWARLSILKEKAKSLSEQLDSAFDMKSDNNVDNHKDTAQSQKQILKIAKVLQEQQNGIKFLSETLQEDEKIVDKTLQ